VRELTKLHEQVIRTTCEEAALKYAGEKLKGEIVLVLAGATPEQAEQMPLEEAVNLARASLAQGMGTSEAAKQAAQASGRRKSEIYAELMKGD